MQHFFFFPPILDSTEAGAFLFCDFLEYNPRGEKKYATFYMFVFLGVHFTAFGVLQHVMNALSVCNAETQIFSCVLFTFCTMSINFHWSKKWYELLTSCKVFCIQAWHFRNFQIMASLCSPCPYIVTAHTTKNLKETCYTCTLQGPIRRCQNFH